VLKLRDYTRKRDKLFSYLVLHPKSTNKLVRTHSAPFWCWDKPRATLDSLDSPRPRFEGRHHLPPYSIICSSPQRLHPNDTISRDSQGGVSKLSRFGLPRLWAFITSCSDLRLGWGMKQSCSSLWELSNAMSNSFYIRRIRVDSRLLVVGSQIASLTPGPFSPITWAANVQMAHAKTFWTSRLQDLFNGIKNTPMRGVLTHSIELWVFGSVRGFQVLTFGTVSFILTLNPKWGCDTNGFSNF
jgi:hypothetical protein